MHDARRTEGPLAPLFYSVVLGLSGVASAQTVDMAALEACSKLETEAAKLECFESIVSGAEASPPVAAEPQSSASAPAPVTVVPAAAPAAVAVERRTVDAVPATVSAATNEQPVADSMAADDFGREHLDQRVDEDPEILRARVVEVTRGNHDALVFHLDNGQVWRQVQPRYYPYPRDRQFDVTISTGFLGEYELQVEAKGRKVNVRRLK